VLDLRAERTILFDAGPDPYALERNVARMGLNFGDIEAVVLSHGHFDHAEGLLKAIELIRRAGRNDPVPLHVHPGVFVRRGIRLPNGDIIPLQEIPARGNLSRAGYVLRESSQPESILDGAFFLAARFLERASSVAWATISNARARDSGSQIRWSWTSASWLST
jgi:7,8-dihydropterin-6-yl-methyl-4-(beta-D-ribofuranosyl)aminobenzene 5'-phosphate synthase